MVQLKVTSDLRLLWETAFLYRYGAIEGCIVEPKKQIVSTFYTVMVQLKVLAMNFQGAWYLAFYTVMVQLKEALTSVESTSLFRLSIPLWCN